MKIDQFIWFVYFFQIFLTAQESYVSRLGMLINLAAGNFASVWQSLQHYNPPSGSKIQVSDVGLIRSRSANPNKKIGLGYL